MATPLEQAIDGASSDPLVRVAMRLAALLEGGSLAGPWPAGDSGRSYGPYQIYTVAHPGVSRAQAEDPQFATAYMAPQFAAAAARLRRDSPNLESVEPMMAAALVAFWAEAPLAMYPVDRIRAAWAKLFGAAGDQGGGTGGTGTNTGTGAIAQPIGITLPGGKTVGAPDPLAGLGELASKLLDPHILARGVLGVVGVALIAIGLVLAVGLAGGEG